MRSGTYSERPSAEGQVYTEKAIEMARAITPATNGQPLATTPEPPMDKTPKKKTTARAKSGAESNVAETV